ncbi:MAG: nicotinamidase [Chloroflexi bacterium]|nr:nicotinamidase [Chloroflexota bacterium]
MAAIGEHDALLIVDPQNDFCPGGALSVPGGDAIFATVNRLIPLFGHVLATQDWHPPNHSSFRNQGGPWPAHCVQGTFGAEFHRSLNPECIQKVIRKGDDVAVDGYSGFAGTNLREELESRGIQRVFVCGLATDYCVRATATEARANGFDCTVVVDAIAAVNVRPADGENALAEMRIKGVEVVDSSELA